MISDETDGRAYASGMATRISGRNPSRTGSKDLWQTIVSKTGSFAPLISVLALAAGILLGTVSDTLSNAVNSSAEAFIDGYGKGAPLLIFVVLAPALSRIFSTRREGAFGVYVISWLAATKILAMLWAVLFTVVVFGMPLISENSVSITGALAQTSKSVIHTLIHSSFFWAIYAAIAVSFIAVRFKLLSTVLEKGVTAVEYGGQFLQPLIPVFMLAVGVYVQSLPQQLNDQIGLEGSSIGFQTLNILGFHIDTSTTSGMVIAYVVGALLVGVACFAWHFAILALAKYKNDQFSLRDYFFNYWVKAYPLLWATSSESLATPLNLYILSRRVPWVRPTVRRLVAGAGSVLCTNGTLISVFILLGLVSGILGIHLSMLELLLAIPVAFLISFGIPGIPGELLLFAGPLTVILAISPEIAPLFLALYLGLQVGLPDSFRTGANATNNYVYCILLNEPYEKRFMAQEPTEEE